MPTAEVKPWYQSSTIWGGVVSLLAWIAAGLGYQVTDTDQAELIQLFAMLAGAIGGLVAIFGRVNASKPIATPSNKILKVLPWMLVALTLSACAFRAGETPAQKLYGLQADYAAVQTVAAAYIEDSQAKPLVVTHIRRLDAAAYDSVLAAQAAVRNGESATIPLAMKAAEHAVIALRDYLLLRGTE